MPYKTEQRGQLNDTRENETYLHFYVNIGKYIDIGVASSGTLGQFPGAWACTAICNFYLQLLPHFLAHCSCTSSE